MKLDKYIITPNHSLSQALVIMDAAGEGFLAVCSTEKKIEGILTDGDVRRALLQGVELQSPISKVYNKSFIYLERKDATDLSIKNLFKTTPARQLPICVDGFLVDIIFEERFLRGEQTVSIPQLENPIPVVIMAGGKGTRMAPFTHVLPKPLIPVGNRTMIEVIMDEYSKFGLSEFYISVNHKSRIIKAYFEEHPSHQKISFIEEDEPLGTAGALKFLEGQLSTPFFVSNCDVLIHADYNEIYKFHRKENYDLTIIGSTQEHTIPYGVCKTTTKGKLLSIEEKPSYNFLVNTGMYLLNSDLLNIIPKNTFYHITHLIDHLMTSGRKVGVFSIPEKAYIDVGQWDEYRDALHHLTI